MMLKKTYYIKTFGCQMNVSDSERIAGFLEKSPSDSPFYKKGGFKPAKDINSADLVVFNTCGVRQTAEDRVYGQIHNLVTQNAKRRTQKCKIILTGCLANRKDVQRRLKEKVDLFCEIKDFPEKLSFLLSFPRKRESSECTRFRTKSGMTENNQNKSYLCISPKYSDKKSAYVPIMSGCNNFCSYCIVPYARGREYSRPIKDVISEIDNLSKNGCEEITLLGQNVNSYRYLLEPSSGNLPELGSRINFPKLLDCLAKSYSKINFKFLTSHPKDFSYDLIKVIKKNKNISREIHLPIQSGSDKILKLMNRPYTQKKYLYLIAKIKKAIPEAGFTTDVIVGFPGETEKDFLETVKVFKKVKYNEAYINKYSPRPGTAAWKLGNPISWDEKKRREKLLRKIIDKS